jgi:hypothetical protein
MRYGEHKFSLPHTNWEIIGVSKHHWRRDIDIPITSDVDPNSLIKGIVWDVDHGTTRIWGGLYYGKIPRIQSAWIEE